MDFTKFINSKDIRDTTIKIVADYSNEFSATILIL